MTALNPLDDVITRFWYCSGTKTWKWVVSGGKVYESYSHPDKQNALDKLTLLISSIT